MDPEDSDPLTPNHFLPGEARSHTALNLSLRSRCGERGRYGKTAIAKSIHYSTFLE